MHMKKFLKKKKYKMVSRLILTQMLSNKKKGNAGKIKIQRILLNYDSFALSFGRLKLGSIVLESLYNTDILKI